MKDLMNLLKLVKNVKKKNIEVSLVWSLYDFIYPELEVKHKLLNVEKLKMFYIWILE